jgi:hypothetical protein
LGTLSGPLTVAPFRENRKTYFSMLPLSESQPPLLPISCEPLTSIEGACVQRGSLATAEPAATSARHAARAKRARERADIEDDSFRR